MQAPGKELSMHLESVTSQNPSTSFKKGKTQFIAICHLSKQPKNFIFSLIISSHLMASCISAAIAEGKAVSL